MRVIGLSAYAQSGKDTAAGFLAELGFERRAFADVLRNCLAALDPIIGIDDDGGCGDPDCCGYPSSYPTLYSEVLANYGGYEGARKTTYAPEIRRLLQRLGTEVGRNLLGENIWVDTALKDLDPNGKYVFTDCRFPNEAQAIKNLGGEVWRIHRKGVGPANDHPSETSLDDWDFDAHIYNNHGLKEFREAVRAVAATSGVLVYS